MRAWKKVFLSKGNEEKAGVAILISEKVDLKKKTIARDRERHYIMTEINPKKDVTIINIHEPNIGIPKSVKQILINTRRN